MSHILCREVPLNPRTSHLPHLLCLVRNWITKWTFQALTDTLGVIVRAGKTYEPSARSRNVQCYVAVQEGTSE